MKFQVSQISKNYQIPKKNLEIEVLQKKIYVIKLRYYTNNQLITDS